MKKFEKHYELGMEITSHRIDDDYHVFMLTFDRELIDHGKRFKSVEWHIFNVDYISWFNQDYPKHVDTDNDVELFDDIDDDKLFHNLFDDEGIFEEAVQKMCIEYCKEHKIPNSLKEIVYEDDGILSIVNDIMETIEKSEIDNLNSEFTIISEYDEDNPFKVVKYTVTNRVVKLENRFLNMEFKTDDFMDTKFINKSCIEFNRNWNKLIIGKYDYDELDRLRKGL